MSLTAERESRLTFGYSIGVSKAATRMTQGTVHRDQEQVILLPESWPGLGNGSSRERARSMRSGSVMPSRASGAFLENLGDHLTPEAMLSYYKSATGLLGVAASSLMEECG